MIVGAVSVPGLEVRLCSGDDVFVTLRSAIKLLDAIIADPPSSISKFRALDLANNAAILQASLVQRYDFDTRIFDTDAAAIAKLSGLVDELYRHVTSIVRAASIVPQSARDLALVNAASDFYGHMNDVLARRRCPTPAPAPAVAPRRPVAGGMSRWWLIPIAMIGTAFGAGGSYLLSRRS